MADEENGAALLWCHVLHFPEALLLEINVANRQDLIDY